MISSAYIQHQLDQLPVTINCIGAHKCVLTSATIPHRFTLVLTFDQPLMRFRNHNYQWISSKKEGSIPEFANKILQLEDGTFVQSSTNQGVWEWFNATPNKLYWHFHPEDAEALTVYTDSKNFKSREGAKSVPLASLPALLFSKSGALELSRTPLPFVGVVCFTDHCDYDTAENLKTQREFFKSIGIKVTKGFFLHHFSKRKDNASWQYQSDELLKWANDGHELAYHSLSQSIKNDSESKNDFLNFKAPLPTISVWIDHGFQPYNWSMYRNSLYATSDFQNVMERNSISLFWNYNDSGRVSNGVINQLDCQQFTFAAFQQSIRPLSFKKRWENRLKNVVFYADNSKRRIRFYIDALAALRQFKQSKKPQHLVRFIFCFTPIIFKLLQFYFGGKQRVNQPYPLARFAPVFFKHQLGNHTYTVFQSLELVDFAQGLSKDNLAKLQDDAGILIAHTYFSVAMKHHDGRFLENETTVAPIPAQNFNHLAVLIQAQKLWNPTISELAAAWEKFSAVTLDSDTQGTIFVTNGFDMPVRVIS